MLLEEPKGKIGNSGTGCVDCDRIQVTKLACVQSNEKGPKAFFLVFLPGHFIKLQSYVKNPYFELFELSHFVFQDKDLE